MERIFVSSLRVLPRAVKGATIKKDPKSHGQSDMLNEYDFSSGVLGKYAERYEEGSNVVVLDPDVARVFPDAESVNQALRALADIINRQSKQT